MALSHHSHLPAFVSSLNYYQRNHPSIPHNVRNGQRIISPQLQSLQGTTRPVGELADDDLVALPFDTYIASKTTADDATKTESSDADDANDDPPKLRLCVVRDDGRSVFPLIRHEDDVETDLFLDPRHSDGDVKLTDVAEYWFDALRRTEDDAGGLSYYGVGWYGQRPVPSLGGGPGYGAQADEIWSVEEEALEMLIEEDGVEVPAIDVGMAHGEKARGGALF